DVMAFDDLPPDSHTTPVPAVHDPLDGQGPTLRGEPGDDVELVGRTLGDRYLVEEAIGAGSMGTVFRGRHAQLRHAVAIKVMHPEPAPSSPTFGERFFREAKAASLFNHVNAVRVLDFGEEPDGLTYLVTELVEGRPLADVVEHEWPLS